MPAKLPPPPPCVTPEADSYVVLPPSPPALRKYVISPKEVSPAAIAAAAMPTDQEVWNIAIAIAAAIAAAARLPSIVIACCAGASLSQFFEISTIPATSTPTANAASAIFPPAKKLIVPNASNAFFMPTIKATIFLTV